MHNAMIYVFRIDYQNENEFVKSELAQGRLRQGWGPIPLRKGDTIDYAPGSFTAGMVARWPGTSTVEAESRYRILYPMLGKSGLSNELRVRLWRTVTSWLRPSGRR